MSVDRRQCTANKIAVASSKLLLVQVDLNSYSPSVPTVAARVSPYSGWRCRERACCNALTALLDIMWTMYRGDPAWNRNKIKLLEVPKILLSNLASWSGNRSYSTDNRWHLGWKSLFETEHHPQCMTSTNKMGGRPSSRGWCTVDSGCIQPKQL